MYQFHSIKCTTQQASHPWTSNIVVFAQYQVHDTASIPSMDFKYCGLNVNWIIYSGVKAKNDDGIIVSLTYDFSMSKMQHDNKVWYGIQWYFSFKIHFSFSFYKFFSQSFLFLYYISIELNNYLSFYKFLHQSFLFYIISVLPETVISVLSSFD